ncbi:MAG: hypothetical protein IPP29_15520 [Bacteroidetes bacterium]|nr:hypothetical protein [Bacteroidota bacterium]
MEFDSLPKSLKKEVAEFVALLKNKSKNRPALKTEFGSNSLVKSKFFLAFWQFGNNN